jgi:hypothetical protein
MLSFVTSGGRSGGAAVAHDLRELVGRQETVRTDYLATLDAFGLLELVLAEDD